MCVVQLCDYCVYSYSHDATQLVVDSITLSVSDGINSVTRTIDIDLRSDQRPAFVDGLERRLQVPEAGSVTLSSRNLAATDDVADAASLTFHVLQKPQHGEIRVDGTEVHRFTQRDVARGAVQYVHTGGEVGQVRILYVLYILLKAGVVAVSASTLLVWRQEGHPACRKLSK